MKPSPFRPLVPFSPRDAAVYVGHERETGRLYNALQESNLVVVHGPQGTGKTSLVHCGLECLMHASEWTPILVEGGAGVIVGLDRRTSTAATAATAGQAPAEESDVTIPERIRRLHRDTARTPYLIFDDVERVFARASAPDQQRLFETIAELSRSRVACKILLVLEERSLTELAGFGGVVPDLLDYRIGMVPPSDAMLARIILTSARTTGIRVDEPSATVDAILEKIRAPDGRSSLGALQVFLDLLWRADLVRQDNLAPAEVRFDAELLTRVPPLEPWFFELLERDGSRLSTWLNLRLHQIDELIASGELPLQEYPLRLLIDDLFADDVVEEVTRDVLRRAERRRARALEEEEESKRLNQLSEYILQSRMREP